MAVDRKQLVKWIDYAKFAVAGAMGGLAVINAAYQFYGRSPTDTIEQAAMAAGAVLLAGLVKALHVA